MSTADSEFLALQAAVAGRFSLEQEIGRGGMGIVYRARDVLLERQVAIKLLAPALGARADMRRRFLREARLAAQCFHPHIVPIHSVEEAGPLAWIVMPYVRGETLAERVRRTGPLPTEEVRRLAQEIGWALAYAHQRGVVHRDVKPENVLIDAASGRFLIADFGIARGDGEGVSTVSGAGAGTPRYMAPEQALGEAVDGRADLYALGATLFVAATGRPPFDANHALALMAQHASVPAPAVRSFAPALPVALGDAIDRCLAKRPDDRFANAERFVEALTPAADERSTPAALEPIRSDAASARALYGWSGVLALTTVFFALGEPSNSFGRAIMGTIGGGFAGLLAAAATVRVVEVVLAARRLLKLGHRPDDVSRALSGEIVADRVSPAPGGRHVLFAIVGALVALSQGRVSHLANNLPAIPGWLAQLTQFGLLLAPPLLIARGAAGATQGTGVARWLHAHVVAPLARTATRVAGRGVPEPARMPVLNAAEPTELVLDRAVHDAIALLSPERRASVGDAVHVASSLAREAESLRREDARLADAERTARHAEEPDDRATELARLAAERDAVRGRLGSAIAALEIMRLDLMRLDSGDPQVTGLTTQLEAVRDLGRRVDADAEVRALLDRHQTTPT